MTTLGICINLKNAAPSQYSGVNFNSVCEFNDALLGANENGIFSLGGDSDNTVNIDAYFELGSSDFGVPFIKAVRAVYISGYSAGGIQLVPLTDNTEQRSFNYSSVGSYIERTFILYVDSDLKGKYWSFKISNISGSDFSIDAIDVLAFISRMITDEGIVKGRLKQNLSIMEISASV